MSIRMPDVLHGAIRGHTPIVVPESALEAMAKQLGGEPLLGEMADSRLMLVNEVPYVSIALSRKKMLVRLALRCNVVMFDHKPYALIGKVRFELVAPSHHIEVLPFGDVAHVRISPRAPSRKEKRS